MYCFALSVLQYYIYCLFVWVGQLEDSHREPLTRGFLLMPESPGACTPLLQSADPGFAGCTFQGDLWSVIQLRKLHPIVCYGIQLQSVLHSEWGITVCGAARAAPQRGWRCNLWGAGSGPFGLPRHVVHLLINFPGACWGLGVRGYPTKPTYVFFYFFIFFFFIQTAAIYGE